MIRLICFDADGVLVDACEWHYEALNRALKEASGIEISRNAHETVFNGLPTKKKLAKLLNDGQIKASDIPKIFDAKQKYTIETIEELAKPDWDKIRLHQRLQDLGIRICCVTNSIRATAQLMLRKTGQLDYMSFLITNEDVKNPKPSPDPYHLAFFTANIAASETLIIEDSPHGLEAAYNSGAHVLECKNAQDVTVAKVLRKIEDINGRLLGANPTGWQLYSATP